MLGRFGLQREKENQNYHKYGTFEVHFLNTLVGFENTSNYKYIAVMIMYIWKKIAINVVASVHISSNWNLECEWKFEDKIGTGCTENVKRSRANLFLVF